jgi:hypothetical protein
MPNGGFILEPITRVELVTLPRLLLMGGVLLYFTSPISGGAS